MHKLIISVLIFAAAASAASARPTGGQTIRGSEIALASGQGKCGWLVNGTGRIAWVTACR